MLLQVEDEVELQRIAKGVASDLNMTLNKTEFDYGGKSGTQFVIKLSGLGSTMFFQSVSIPYCSSNKNPDYPQFSRSLYAVNVGTASQVGRIAAISSVQRVARSNGATIFTSSRQACAASIR